MFDGQEFLDVAGHLQQADSREAFRRSAISRAYYAAFHLARAYCRERGWIAESGSGSDHRKLAGILARVDAGLASELRELRLLRNEADYSVETMPDAELALNVQYAIELAELIRARLAEMA